MLLILGLWMICYAYEQFWGNADGFIGNIVYKNIFTVLLVLSGLGFLLSLGLTVRYEVVQNITLTIFSGLFFIAILEGTGYLMLELNLVKSPPSVFRRFYVSSAIRDLKPFPAGDLNPITGRSHVPNGSYKFINCAGDSIHWMFNSAGANDKERAIISPTPTKKRIAIVGDSFMEGYMINNAQRCSNILEQQTGLEHLNFAVNSSNPLNYYLTYKSIVKSYCPDVLIVGFLPANDFEIYTEQDEYKLVDWPVYVPYWQGTYPNYSLHYSLAHVSQSINYGNHTQVSLLKVVDSVYAKLSLSGKFKADYLAHSSISRLLGELNAKKFKAGQITKYEQFNDVDWERASYSLTKLMNEAKGVQVIVLSIPTLWDLKAFRIGRINRLDPLLAKLCHQNGAKFISLAPPFLAYRGNAEHLYVPCDGHWSTKGEAYAATVVLHHPIYRATVGLP